MGHPELFLPSTERVLSDWLRASATGPTPAVTGTGDLQPGSSLPDGESASGLTVVSTSHMAEVASFRPRNLTIEAGAGLRMQRLQEIVDDEGLWIPTAGIGAARSIGGWIAAASPAVWDATLGPVRRQLLACRVIAPDGSDLTWGRAVMKNVAGYDLPRLMTGSRGRLGVLTRVTLRLWPRPGAITAWEIRGRIDPNLLESAEIDAVAWNWTRAEGERITAMFAGSASSVQRRERSLVTRVRASGATIVEADTGLAQGGGPRERLPGSVVYRLTPGRRYLPETFRDLVALDDARLTTIEAIPESGTLLVFLDPDRVGADASRALLPHCSPSAPRAGGSVERRLEIGIERGGPVAHNAAEAMRTPETRAIERRVEQALGAWPRAWQADYL
jgi:FAD/FMN-containing dehydrogenase